MCLQKFSTSLQIFQNLPLDSYLHVTYMCFSEISPPPIASSLQIFQNLPLDSYLSYLHVLTEISAPSLQIFQNLPLDSYLQLPTCCRIPPTPQCRNSPQFADFPKSATGQIPTCACRNYLPGVQIFQNLPLDSSLSYLHVLAEIPPPSLQIFQNLPLDSYLPTCACRNYPPPICRFSKICHWTVT